MERQKPEIQSTGSDDRLAEILDRVRANIDPWELEVRIMEIDRNLEVMKRKREGGIRLGKIVYGSEAA